MKERGQAFLDDLFFPVPFNKPRRIALAAKGEVIEGRDDALEFLDAGVLVAHGCNEFVQAMREDHPAGLRRDRQLIVVIMDPEVALGILQSNLLIFEDQTVQISENRQQDFIFQFRLDGTPVDIEEARVRGTRSVVQDIRPPRIRRARNPHVVWNDIQNLAHAMRLEGLNEDLVLLLGADFRIEPGRIR